MRNDQLITVGAAQMYLQRCGWDLHGSAKRAVKALRCGLGERPRRAGRGIDLDAGQGPPGAGRGDAHARQRARLDLAGGGDLCQGAGALHGRNADGGRATCRSMVELPGGAIHPRVLRQRLRLQGTFDFQEGDAALVGGHDESLRWDGEGGDGGLLKGGPQGLLEGGQVGKGARGVLPRVGGGLGLPECRCWGEQGLQAVAVFGHHGLLVEGQQVVKGLAFDPRAGRTRGAGLTLVAARRAARQE